MNLYLKVFLLTYLLCTINFTYGQVGLQKRNPDNSAVVDAGAMGNKGLLLPRMDASNSASQSPIVGQMKEGLLIFNTSTIVDGITVKPTINYWISNKWNRPGFLENMAKSVVAQYSGAISTMTVNESGYSGHANTSTYVLSNEKIIPGIQVLKAPSISVNTSPHNYGQPSVVDVPFIILPNGEYKIEAIYNMTSATPNSSSYYITAGVNGVSTNLYNMGIFWDILGFKVLKDNNGTPSISGNNLFHAGNNMDTRVEKSVVSALNTVYTLSFNAVLVLNENFTALRFNLGRRLGSMFYGDISVLNTSKVIITKVK